MKRFLNWCKDVAVRAVKTFGQSTMGVLVIDKATPLHSNWEQSLQVGLAAAVVSILWNLSNLNLGNDVPPVVTIVNQAPPVVADIDDPLDGLDDSDVGPAGDQLDPPK